MQKLDLPKTWVWATVSDLGKVVSGGTPSTKEPTYWGGDVAWISPSDLTGYFSKFISKGAKSITQSGLQNSSANVMPAGSVHFSSRAPIGYTVISTCDISTNQGFKSLVPAAGVFNEYIYYYFKSAKQLAESLATGTTFKEISGSAFSKMLVPLPPTTEQQRIVAKIEELFSELDKGVENFRAAQRQLKVYRQALLKHAFEGKLSAGWRAQNSDKLESADALLARIQQEREARYQQQLQEWKANGKTGRKPKKQQALPPLTTDELAELPELPRGWKWVHPEEISAPEDYAIGIGPFGSNLKVSDYRESGVPLIFVRNITRSDFSRDLKYIDHSKYLELTAHAVKPLDLVITKMGDPPGDCEIYPADAPEAVLTADCLKFRLWEDFANRLMYKNCINSTLVRRQLGLITKGVAQKKISVGRFKTICLPLMCIEEQKQIAQSLDEKFSLLDQLEKTITHSLQQAEALRQSILKKAFSGQLVAQDANDEPASVLLERIKAEKQAKPAAGKRTQRTAPAALPNNVVPMPARIPGIASTDLHAGILALAYSAHEAEPKYLPYFGHVKGEKVSHLVEAHLGIELDRAPVKDAAGPNDYPHLKKIESRARKVGWFDMRREPGEMAYSLHKLAGFNELQVKTRQALGPRLSEVEALLRLLLPLNTRQAEIVATLYAAWNNLLLAGVQPSDQQIIFEARDNWHPDKLKIEQERFEKGLIWMKTKGLAPTGQGRPVMSKPA